MFKHFIFTRFNLLLPGQSIYNNPKIKDPDEWMEHRINLFRKYTLPSMKNQSNQNFIWVLSFAEETSRYFRELLWVELRRYKNIHVIWEYHKDWMKKEVPRTELLITSRIDNDDYYHPLFIEMIQTWAINSQPYTGIIDIDYTQLDHATGEHYSSQRNTANSPFISLVESWDKDIKTVFHCSHTNMMNHFNHYKINMRMATMVVHDRNISNKIVGDKL